MNNLESKILEYGRNRETSNLQELIYQTDKEKLVDLVKNRLNSPNFECLWDYLLKSFQDSPKCHNTRISLILTFLKKLDEREVVSSHQSCSLVQRICMDLMKLKSEHLVDLCNFCLESIQSNKTGCNLSLSWKDLLPNTLRVLSERDMVEFNELEYTGQEFKTNIINTLCMSNWSPSIITSLTAMFIDMPLTKEERLKVVNKLASYIEKLTPQEVPPFVYHLLRLCQHQNSRAVFLKLQHYFGLRIYSSARNNSSETPDLDIIEDAEDHDAIEAENTILFHIHNAASIGHNCIKDYINSLKNCIKSPDFILHPFQLLTLFTIATVQQYEETVFDIIRHSIVRSYHEQQKQTSYWYRNMISSPLKAEDAFVQIINSGDREFILEALVNFGFTLLGVGSALGRDVIAEKQWNLGTLILLKIIKRKKHVTSIILKTFCNHIITRQNATQYIEFLYILCKTCPLLMLENQSCIVELTEGLIQMHSNSANLLLDPLMLLTKVSPTIRDQLILILRKALYSRSTETRQMAVNGFVKLITTLRISGGGVLSQSGSGSFSSGYSLYTQISLNRTTQTIGASIISSEAICWEVLGILKRCFMQQAEVRARLYDVLFDAVCVNSELAIPVLDVFWFHFVEYYVMDEESNPPLNFKKVVDLRETDSILVEPLGKFIFTISQVVAKALQSEDDRDNPTVVNYVRILDSLCNRMSNCELVHFELDDGTDLTDILPESQQKLHILKEVINVYEALMGYKIATLSIENENQCLIIYSLYQGYSRFSHFGKNISKPKKSKKNDKSSQKDVGKQSQKTSKETQSQATRKIEQGAKSQSKIFKAPDTLLDFATVEKALKTLLESSVPWTTTNDANTIKTKTEIHRHFVHASIHLVGKNKNQKMIDGQYQKNYYAHVTEIAATLFNRIITRFGDYVDFDCMSAVSSVECFHAVLLLINGQFKNNLINFLSKVGGKSTELELIEHLEPIIKQFQKLFETEEDDLSSDLEIKRLSFMVINVLNVLCSFIPDGSNVLSIQAYDWLKQYAWNNTVSSKVAGTFSSLLFETHLRYQEGLTLFERLSSSLKDVIGIIDEETVDEEYTDDFKLVNVGTSNTILQTLCSYVKNILDDVDSIIARVKSDYYVLTYPGEDNDDKKRNALKAKEKGVSCQLLFVVEILVNFVRIAIPPGNISDAVFKNIIQLYSSLSSLTKYFMSRSSKDNLAFQGVWFERLVKKAGKKLAPLVYKLIIHLEGYHNQEDQTQGGKKKAVEGSTMKTKVLRETKMIPKVIYEIEQFSKTIIQLTKKTKFDLSKYVGQGTVRDFRILQPALKEVLQKDGATANTTQSTQDDAEESGAVRSDAESCIESNDENEISTSPPPTKKTKR